MSLSTSDLTELMELWEELNLTSGNLSRVEALLCPGAVSRAAFLHALCVLYVFIFLVGVAANALVVWVNLRRDSPETHLYVLNLAVADLCVVATLPVWVSSLLHGGRWLLGDAACKLTHLVFSVNLFGSIFFLTCMSVDRYVSVTLLGDGPGNRRRRVTRRLICILVWLLALAAALPETYFLQAARSHHDGAVVCRPVYPPDNPRVWMVAVQLSFTVLGFAVPLPVLAVSYLLLAAAVPGGSPERRVILAYIVVFVACWLPLHAVLVLDAVATGGALGFSCGLEVFLDVALQLTQCCSLLHCCLNPVLYSFLSRGDRYRLVRDAIARFSAKTGLAGLLVVPGSHAPLAGDEEDGDEEDEEDTVVQDISSL